MSSISSQELVIEDPYRTKTGGDDLVAGRSVNDVGLHSPGNNQSVVRPHRPGSKKRPSQTKETGSDSPAVSRGQRFIQNQQKNN